jgi:spermidine/putrescine transport system permease protein
MLTRFRHYTTQYLPFFLGVPVVLWQLLFFCIPLVLVVVLSVVYQDPLTCAYGFTIQHFFYFFKHAYARIMLRSLLLAFTNACICLVIAYPLAYFLAFKARRLKNLLLFLLIVPFWTNFLLHVYAWFFVLDRNGILNALLFRLGIISQPLQILNTMGAVGIMMAYYYLPFMALPLYSILEKFDQKLVEASLDLGATWWQTFRKVIVPLTFPAIVSGFFLVYVPSFAEFAIPELLGGDKKMVVGSVVSRFILGATTLSYGAAFTVISSLVLVISAFIIYIVMRKIVKAL